MTVTNIRKGNYNLVYLKNISLVSVKPRAILG